MMSFLFFQERYVYMSQLDVNNQFADVRIMTLKRWNFPLTTSIYQLAHEDKLRGDYISFQNYHLIDISKVTPHKKERELASAYKQISENRQHAVTSNDDFSILQNILLFGSDEEFWTDDIETLYITMIQLYDQSNPHSIEDIAADLKCTFNDTYGSNCALYYSLDFCDFVLFTKNASLNSFHQLLCLLSSAKTKEQSLRIVRDTITICSFKKDQLIHAFENIKEHKDIASFTKTYPSCMDKLSLSIDLSIQDYSQLEQLYNKLHTISSCIQKVNTLGRYDVRFVAENLTFDNILRMLFQVDSLTTDNVYTSFGGYEILLLPSTEQSFLSTAVTPEPPQLINSAISAIQHRYDGYCSILSLSGDKALGYAAGLKNSLLALIKNGFSEEFALSVLPSFLMYLDTAAQYQNSIANPPNSTSPAIIRDHKYALQREYLQCLSTLIHCTMHGEKQFFQAPALNVNIFDIPPKLLAFYSALAYQITDILRDSDDTQHTFLIAPDFRQDIYVKPVSRDSNTSDHILIMYLNEEQFYNPVTVIQVMCHEIAHHIGSEPRNRQYRAETIFHAFAGYILHVSIPINWSDNTQLLEELSNIFCQTLLDRYRSDYEYRKNQNINKSNTSKLYYLNDIEQFLSSQHYLIALFDDSLFINALRQAWTNGLCSTHFNSLSIPLDNTLNSTYVTSLSQFSKTKATAAQIIADTLISHIQRYFKMFKGCSPDELNTYYGFWKNIIGIYREAYADMKMVELLGITDTFPYMEILKNNIGASICDDYYQLLRCKAVCDACELSTPITFFPSNLKDDEIFIISMVSRQITRYLKLCKHTSPIQPIQDYINTFKHQSIQSQIDTIRTAIDNYKNDVIILCNRISNQQQTRKSSEHRFQ